jgi:heat shock protein HtpX
MADFGSLIARNRRNTYVLVGLMTLFLGVLGYVFGAHFGDWVTGVAVALAMSLTMTLFSYYGGAGTVLALSGAKEITHADAPQLFNVVEELTLAAGVPMPKVYVINDTAPNAFATGRDAKHAAVAITSGLLSKLNRNELQGVMAHELSHVRHRDILFAMMMAVMVGVIVLLCDVFWRWSFWGGGRRRRTARGGGQAQLIIALVAIVLAIIAPILAKIIQLAVSRQREYMADAGAVELTRYPEGLAAALEKIANDPEPLEVANRATQHLYIVNPLKKAPGTRSTIWSTHPDIRERIARLRAMT